MIKNLALTTLVFLGIDFVWLGLVAKKLYDRFLAPFERTLSWPAALLTYLLLILGITFLVLPKAQNHPLKALFWGAFFGLITYGVYDLTNLATLKKWSPTMVIVDMIWGMFLCGITAMLVTLIKKW